MPEQNPLRQLLIGPLGPYSLRHWLRLLMRRLPKMTLKMLTIPLLLRWRLH